MIRGTTPTHIFQTGVDLSTVSTLWLTYRQRYKVVTKTLDDVTIDENDTTQFSVTLTQKETLLFEPGIAYIQCRALTASGTALASPSISLMIADIQKDGEIS
ncbi:MAG: hypothetical protein K5637_02015 [Lachnospiraceae bacterium]|nr:hypothetical protein [Lachnospiraceae bacterium]